MINKSYEYIDVVNDELHKIFDENFDNLKKEYLDKYDDDKIK